MKRYSAIAIIVAATATLCLSQVTITIGTATTAQGGAVFTTGVFVSSAPAASQPATSPAATSQAASKPAAGWAALFADEAWYKKQAGEEKTFSGKLESVTPPEISTLQRDSYYKLGDRTVYTGGKKVDALDKLVGKAVEIRGKAYDISLEGKGVSEIWPAAVREKP